MQTVPTYGYNSKQVTGQIKVVKVCKKYVLVETNGFQERYKRCDITKTARSSVGMCSWMNDFIKLSDIQA